MMCKSHVRCLADIAEMIRIHRPGNYLHVSRMTQDPCDGSSGFGYLVLAADHRKRLIQFLIVRMVDKASLEHTDLQRRPCLDSDVVEPAVIQDAVVPVIPLSEMYFFSFATSL